MNHTNDSRLQIDKGNSAAVGIPLNTETTTQPADHDILTITGDFIDLRRDGILSEDGFFPGLKLNHELAP